MAAKKPTKGLNNAQKALYKCLVPPIKKLVLGNPPNRDGYGLRNRVQITWTKAFQKPQGFPVGKLISDVDGKRTLEYLACTCLTWLHKVGLTRDTPKSIYAARQNALISLAKIEGNLFNFDERILQELIDSVEKKLQNVVSEQNEGEDNEQ